MISKVIPFVPKSGLAAKAALHEFISWAKSQISLYDKPLDPIQWEAMSWHRWGLRQAVCSKLGKKHEMLHPEFFGYCKAMLFYERALKLSEDPYRLHAMRCLEKALLEITARGDVTAVAAVVFDRACAVAEEHFNSSNTVYRTSVQLECINDHLHELGAVAKPFIWESQVKAPKKTLKQSAENSQNKLPSNESLLALGNIFHNKPELPLDIMTTSAAAIMLSHPCRIGEMKYTKYNCLFTEYDMQGREQLYIRWHSVKGFGANRKPIPDSMAEICKEAVSRVAEITQEAREYAKWLEDNPESFPYHEDVPNKHLDSRLSVKEACDALLISTKIKSPRASFKLFLEGIVERKVIYGRALKVAQEFLEGYDEKSGSRSYVNKGLAGHELQDTWVITLRKINILVREKYLPKHFPYTDANKVTKWQDALFCFRTEDLLVAQKESAKRPFGLSGCEGSRLGAQLTGSQKNTQSIFKRYGYVGVTVKSHAFRHLLNTAAQRVGLSQELIARWSGRIDVTQNSVYNHMSTEEKVIEVEEFTPQIGAESSKLLASIKNKTPISMKDLGDESDRVVHYTEFGVCIHDYAQEPCAKFNNCLTCGEHVCVKGDATKLENLKDERKYLSSSLEAFQREADEGTYGANTWLKTTLEKMERCDQLIEMLESPDIEDGALVKGIENRWTAGRNALAMRGELLEEEDASLIATDKPDDQVAELERLLGLGG